VQEQSIHGTVVAHSDETRWRGLVPLLAGLLGLAVLALFWPTTHCDFTNYDDPVYVTSNAHVKNGISLEDVRWAFSAVVSANWHPVTLLSHMLDCQVFGLNPWGHHLTSILLHSLNAMLVFVWLRQMTGAVWRSFFVALFFGCHPLRAESVVWIAERKDVLSGFFGLLALIFYVRYAQARSAAAATTDQVAPPPAPNTRLAPMARWGWSYGFTLVFFALGLMSKPMLVTWPFVMLLLDYWPLNRVGVGSGRRWLHLLWEKWPLFALSAGSSVATFLAQKAGGAVAQLQNVPLEARLENALISYFRYLGKMFWPEDYSVLYLPPGHWPLAAVVIAGAGWAGTSILFWLGRRRYPYFLVGWLWYIGIMVPVIGLVQVGVQAMANRYTYLPCLGILIGIVWGADEAVCRWRALRVPVLSGGAAAIIACAFLTLGQLPYWQDGETLFRQALKVTEAADASAVDTASRYNLGTAHYNLGGAVDHKGKIAEAIAEYQEALRYRPDGPGIHSALGADFVKVGDSDRAIAELTEALRLKPDDASAHNDLANALDQKGQTDEAIRQYQEAIRLQPDLAEAHSNLGAAFGKKGMVDEAIAQLLEAERLQVDNPLAFYNLGMAFYQKGRTNDAIQQLTAALRLKPDFSVARDALMGLQPPAQ
jgi:tetratricopeptide (TPR) repeat protein